MIHHNGFVIQMLSFFTSGLNNPSEITDSDREGLLESIDVTNTSLQEGQIESELFISSDVSEIKVSINLQ